MIDYPDLKSIDFKYTHEVNTWISARALDYFSIHYINRWEIIVHYILAEEKV